MVVRSEMLDAASYLIMEIRLDLKRAGCVAGAQLVEHDTINTRS